ncbi:hypothetical protein NW064_06285 [Mycoplasmopsis felis]|uniref:hypothetical protein n=1 Tax=Mycoplasmopsis felis TaxID=33923 RepID=UPI0021AE6ED2|nr:hypothetical protein [Mycoplasmopsis felis]UWW00769.1 hypothetical protein NW064_06285 [Mycoplasmopsis felis]
MFWSKTNKPNNIQTNEQKQDIQVEVKINDDFLKIIKKEKIINRVNAWFWTIILLTTLFVFFWTIDLIQELMLITEFLFIFY